MTYSKFSTQDDEQLRTAAQALIMLRSEKLADIAKRLHFDPGGLSGWLRGTPNRLSPEKKDKLSAYLGLASTHLAPNVVHRWSTSASALEEYLPTVITKPLVSHIKVVPVHCDSIPIGCAYTTSLGDTAILILCKQQTTSCPIPVIDTERTGWGTLAQPINIDRKIWNRWYNDIAVSPEEVYAYIFGTINRITQSNIDEFLALSKEIMESGLDIEMLREFLAMKKKQRP